MATSNYQQNERKLRKIIHVITVTKEELDNSIIETRYSIEFYSQLLPRNLPGQRNAWDTTLVTIYSVLQVLHNN